MSKAVSRQPVTPETRVQSQVSPGDICGGKRGIWTGYVGFLVSVSLHFCLIIIVMYMLHLSEGQSG